MTRKLATLETIENIRPIEGADAIDVGRVRGWDVVIKKGEYADGDLCVYIEVDTLLDTDDPRFAFLSPRGVRTDAEGNSGHVLKTAKLRGQYSQGLVLPLDQFPETAGHGVGDDITELLPIKRWDPPMPANLAGVAIGRRPNWIPATDEERIENLAGILDVADADTWVATEKLDGTSTTVYVCASAMGNDFNPDDPTTWHGTWGVCSRNYDLAHDGNQAQWKLAVAHRLHPQIEATWPNTNVAVQGETIGEGIQGNPLKLKGSHLALFTIRVDGEELPRGQWPAWALELAVPEIDLTFPKDIEQAKNDVDGMRSTYSPGAAAEGVVWRSMTNPAVTLPGGTRVRASFKVISRKYLLKHDQ